MNPLENITLKGQVNIRVVDTKTNTLKQDITIPNQVVAVGKEWVADRISANTVGVMTHMAIGEGATAVAPLTDNALGTQLAIVALTGIGEPSGATVTYSASFAATVGTGTLREAGIFNAASSGTMLARTTFDAINKAAADAITITWIISLS